jgi:hypothetical protein
MLKIYGLFIITFLSLAGCGDSGGGAGIQPTIATVTFATQGALQTGKTLSGIGITLQLPSGVTPTLAPNGAVESGVVKASGVSANDVSQGIPTDYTPSSAINPGTLSFVLASSAADGFGIGEFATVTLNIAPGTINFSTVDLNSAAGPTSSVATGFKVTSFSPRDLAGVPVNNISVTLAVETI